MHHEGRLVSILLPNLYLEVCCQGVHADSNLSVGPQLLPDLLASRKDLGLVTDQLPVEASKINHQAKCQWDSSRLLHKVGWRSVLTPD